jgi:Sec-independent protein secretion pathway component TatC
MWMLYEAGIFFARFVRARTEEGDDGASP